MLLKQHELDIFNAETIIVEAKFILSSNGLEHVNLLCNVILKLYTSFVCHGIYICLSSI